MARCSSLLHCVYVCLCRVWVQGWPRDRPFVFDVVAASALCERADYDSQALFVGLTVAQDWTLRLQVSTARN